MTDAYLHNMMSDNELRTIANETTIARDPAVHEKNLAFRARCLKELEWRDANNKHYSDEQKIKDMIDHQEKICQVYKANPNHKGYIPPDKYWWED